MSGVTEAAILILTTELFCFSGPFTGTFFVGGVQQGIISFSARPGDIFTYSFPSISISPGSHSFELVVPSTFVNPPSTANDNPATIDLRFNDNKSTIINGISFIDQGNGRAIAGTNINIHDSSLIENREGCKRIDRLTVKY